MLKNKAADAICKPDAVESISTGGIAPFSSNAPYSRQNKGAAALCRFDADEAVYLGTLVFPPTRLLSVFGNEYLEPNILGDKRSLVCVVIESSRKEDRTNLRTKQIGSQQNIRLSKQVKRL